MSTDSNTTAKLEFKNKLRIIGFFKQTLEKFSLMYQEAEVYLLELFFLELHTHPQFLFFYDLLTLDKAETFC